MIRSEYTRLKVNNEIELCEASDMKMKSQIERILLQNRISYYIKWQKSGWFRRNRNSCVFYVNDSIRDDAEQMIRLRIKNVDSIIKFTRRRSEEIYF
mgnify:CR=1 FL=1